MADERRSWWALTKLVEVAMLLTVLLVLVGA